MLAAATAWSGLATELHSVATVYESTITDLASSAWWGPSAAAMAAAAAPYQKWMRATAVQAEAAALQANAAASAYEAAHAATVPPPVVAANRMLLAALVATNFLGQNAPAIAAAEAHYAQMWAQDAAAMYAYAGSAASATELTPFTAPPETTNGGAANAAPASAGSGAQSALTDLISQLPTTLQSLTTNPASVSAAVAEPVSGVQNILDNITAFLKTVDGPYSPLGVLRLFKNWWQVSSSLVSVNNGGQSLATFFSPKPITGALAPLLASELLTGAPAVQPAGVSASTATGVLGRAAMVGSLSVPANWAAAVPGAAPAIQTLAATTAALDAAPAIAVNGQNGLFGQMALSSLAGRALSAQAGHAVGATATTRTIGAITHVTNAAATPDIATTATIIVIPPVGK